VVFGLLSDTVFETLYQFPEYSPRLIDLFYAAPLGIVGGVVGLLFMLSLRRLQRLFQVMKEHVVLRGLVSGLGIGLIGALLPLMLFSGESETNNLINHAAEIGILMLIVSALAKLFATSLRYDLPNTSRCRTMHRLCSSTRYLFTERLDGLVATAGEGLEYVIVDAKAA
jgi:H+/Cl- antiporter ClcA